MRRSKKAAKKPFVPYQDGYDRSPPKNEDEQRAWDMFAFAAYITIGCKHSEPPRIPRVSAADAAMAAFHADDLLAERRKRQADKKAAESDNSP